MSLLDTENGVLKNNYQVLIEENKITSVQKGEITASKCKKIDLGGRTLMPGLIDCHVHVHIGQFNDNKTVFYTSTYVVYSLCNVTCNSSL